MAFFEELGKKAMDVAGVVAEKTKDAAEITKLKMEILSEERELGKNYKALGEWFASEYDGEIPDAVKDVVAAINASKDRIDQLEAMKAAVGEDDEEEPIVCEGEVVQECPVCGTFTNSQSCPECGAPMGK